MAHPKRRTSRSKKRMRRSHHALRNQVVTDCSYCGETMVSHRACTHCGQYKGRSILKTTEEEG
ncbi:50S ribosomal protein L32 [Candidatus Poribacteria bacterium]|nr:50S ribosomal protein L32 [Candidatus Poribacteria bacterium]